MREHIVTQHWGKGDPANIGDYVKNGGYQGLVRVLKQYGAGRVFDEVARSRLRGRGGHGCDVASKWRAVCEAPGPEKFVICNAYDADERAPISSTLLQMSPHSVIEGMVIAAFAVGAKKGYIYCKAGATAAIAAINKAIEQAREHRFLGYGVQSEEVEFEISLATYWGGFVGGEETAMLAAMSGQRAMPWQQPPYPAQSGFRGRPTLIHNAETLAALPWIMVNGAEAFARVGTPESTGSKIFMVDGDFESPCMVELAFGTTVREAIAEAAEQTAGGKASGQTSGPLLGKALGEAIGNVLAKAPDQDVKAVHMGGPLGGCLPTSALDTPLDYAALQQRGVTLGSGRITVLNRHACMVGYAQQVLSYLADEACGKCSPCRLGTKRVATILAGITSNLGQPEDLDLLIELGQNVSDSSLCDFGIASPTIFKSTLEHFREDYEQHLQRRRCPTERCQVTRGYRYQRRAVL